MESITFRPANKSDLPTLLEFEQGIISFERPFNPTIRAKEVTYYDIGAFMDRADAEVVVGTKDFSIFH